MRKNERKDKRVGREFFVRFGLDHLDNAGMTLDLSPHGMFIKSDVHYPIHSTLNIELFISDSVTVQLTGIVIWTKHISSHGKSFSSFLGMGIHFFNIPKEQKSFLENLPPVDE